MKSTLRVYIMVIIAIIVFGLAIVGWYLFRTVTADTPWLGSVSVRYRWGFPHLVEADQNRDGHIDTRAIWPGYKQNNVPEEAWIDAGFYGWYKYHLVYEKGELVELEIDGDGDGSYESRIIGESAKEYLRENDDFTQRWWE